MIETMEDTWIICLGHRVLTVHNVSPTDETRKKGLSVVGNDEQGTQDRTVQYGNDTLVTSPDTLARDACA